MSHRHVRGRIAKVSLVCLLVATFGCVLLADSLLHPRVGVDARGAIRPADAGVVPDAVWDARNGGVVLGTDGDGTLRSRDAAPRTVALSFDDGPDPGWTPRVMEVLARHGVPATFFVIGSQVVKNPEVIEQMRRAGHEVGLHTFTHPDLTAVDSGQRAWELDETQLALAGATGEASYLVRPPYSSGPESLDTMQLEVIRELGDDGYVTALSDQDGRDWDKVTVEEIVAASMPSDGQGGVVLLHDAGGDRSRTLAALDRLIPELKARGYAFTTVTGAVGLPPANHPAGPSATGFGFALLGAVSVAGWIVTAVGVALLVVGALVLLRLLVMVVPARRHRRQRHAATWSWGPPVTEPVSVVVPAYNERECITSAVRALAASDHPVEIIVVDDGSTDGTGDLAKGLGLPNVRVIRQVNAGKPAALNTGIAAAHNDIIVMMDGDTVFEPGTVRALAQPFADSRVGAVAGNAKIANRRGLLGAWQHIEYVIGFNLDRRAYDLWRCMPTVPGAVGAFRRSALAEVGGVGADTLAEDTDVTMAVCAAGWRVVYEDRARAWTEAPGTLRQLWLQRYRWCYGTIQSMWKHRATVRAAGAAGRFGRLGLLNLALFQVLLPALAPLVDVFLVYGLLVLDPLRTVIGWTSVVALQLVVAVFAFRLEGERLRPLWTLPLQQFVYRQIMYAVLVQSVATALAGVRLRWQKLRRVGDFSDVPRIGADRALAGTDTTATRPLVEPAHQEASA